MQRESQHVVSEFAERSGQRLKICLELHEEAMGLPGTTALPFTYWVDAYGQVRLARFGAIDRGHVVSSLARVAKMGGSR
jgi:hypothetical protein